MIEQFTEEYDKTFYSTDVIEYNKDFMEGWDDGYTEARDNTSIKVDNILAINKSENYMHGYVSGFKFHSYMNYMKTNY